jgi:hypothetical protein
MHRIRLPGVLGFAGAVIGALAIRNVSPARPPSSPAGPKLVIDFTGSLLFRKLEGDIGYKVIAPVHGSHTAYVRFSPENYDPSSTIKPPLKTDCKVEPQQYVVLKTEGLSIKTDLVSDQPPAGPPNAFARVATLSDLAGGSGVELNSEYDKPTPAEKKVATQFRIDRGSLRAVVEDGYVPWWWRFHEFSKDANGDIVKGKYCGQEICGISAIQLTLQLKEDQPVTLVSSRDLQRILVLKSKDGKPIHITFGNSRKEDIECRGEIKHEPDPDFDHHYVMLKNVKRRCIPFPGTECGKDFASPNSPKSKGGSDCVGAQWP